MIAETNRVLRRGGKLITLSLHHVNEIVHYYTQAQYLWSVQSFHVKNSRWNPDENSQKNVAHTLILCTKGASTEIADLSNIPGILDQEELTKLLEYSLKVP